MEKNDCLVICPVYNEEEYLRDFYKILRKEYRDDVVFIDDGSTDKSNDVLLDIKDRRTFLIRHSGRNGYGAALISGFKFLLDKNYKRGITVDVDLQHNPEHINIFLDALLRYEIVLGSRYIRFNRCLEVPGDRLLINRYVSELLKLLFSANITDPFCGFRGYRSSFLKKAYLREKGYNMGLEIILEIIRTKTPFKEIPVEAIYFNPQRKFGGELDNANVRLLHYLDVIARKKKEIENEEKIFSCQPSSG